VEHVEAVGGDELDDGRGAMLTASSAPATKTIWRSNSLPSDDAAVLLDVEDLAERGAQGADEAGGEPGEDERTDGEEAGGLPMKSLR
jgi:hypothetical protein